MALTLFVGPWPLFQFLNFYTVGRTPWTGDQTFTRPLPTHRTARTQNKLTQTSMPRMGFESTIPTFERAKTVHALDRAATVTGKPDHYCPQLFQYKAGWNIFPLDTAQGI
jgi:hypothetical protein